MNRETSTYLDLVRFTAALAVLVDHISGRRFTGGLFWQYAYGDEAVDVFFVLSGFVIAYVVDRSETDLRSYSVARLARIYSVACPALIATFVLDTIGRSIRPDLYSAAWGYVNQGQPVQFISSIFFVNRLWWSLIKQGSDVSYWSLSYEAWYYVIFAAAFFGRKKCKIISTLGAICIAGPNIVALFPLWLMGAGCYYLSKQKLIGSAVGTALCFGSILMLLGYEYAAWHGHRLDKVVPEVWFHRAVIVQDYLVALLFAMHLAGFQAISSKFGPLLRPAAPVIRWCAGATFTIYLFHVPVAQFLTTIVPWPPTSWLTRVVMYPGVIALMFLIAEFTERRKDIWRKAFASLFAHLEAVLKRPARVRV